MTEPSHAQPPHEPPPPSEDAHEILRQASGGRLLLRLGIGALLLGAIAAGGHFGRKFIRARAVREQPMASIAATSVTIGNDFRRRDEGLSGGIEERPAHKVEVSAFRIDMTEVTVESYAVCVDDGGCTPAASGVRCNGGRPDRLNHPINCVSYTQAEAFCRWAKKRLPTEVEWELAAGGASPKRTFPWGDRFAEAGSANICGAECVAGARPPPELLSGTICSRDGTCRHPIFDFDDGYPETAPVGSFPAGATPDGILDMAGNVWEWTSSLPCTYPAHDCADGGERVIRGSGWTHRYLMSPEVTTRDKLAVGSVSDGVGIRCVK
ncbi:MAG: SUMF1/EgtB/PvdO family nonheme iron enzyme [Byssovorax sp.]